MKRADRKKQLIAQGAVYRAELYLAKQDVHECLQPGALAKSALRQVPLAAFALFGRRNSNGLVGAALLRFLPLVTGAVSALLKKTSSLKGALGITLLAGAAAGLAAYLAKKQ